MIRQRVREEVNIDIDINCQYFILSVPWFLPKLCQTDFHWQGWLFDNIDTNSHDAALLYVFIERFLFSPIVLTERTLVAKNTHCGFKEL